MLIAPQIFSLADDYDIYKVLATDFLLSLWHLYLSWTLVFFNVTTWSVFF